MASKGAIVIDTRLNDDGVKKGWQALLDNAKKLASQYNKSVDVLTKEEAELDKLKSKLDLITSGNTTPASIKSMESELKKTTKEAENLKKQLDSMEVDIDTKNTGLGMTASMYGKDSSQYQKELADRDALLQKDIEMGEQYDDLSHKAQILSENIKEAKLDPSTTIEAQELANKIELTEQKLANSKEEANGLKDRLAGLAKTNFANILSKGANGIKSGFEAIGSKIDKLKTKMTRLALTAMVFSAIRNSLSNLRKDLTAMLMSNDQFASSLNQIKASLATAFAPIYNAVLPALNTLMNVLAKVTGTIATFVASLFGKTASQAKANAEALQEQKNATEGLAKAQGKLASFDTLEVNDPSKSSGGGSNIDFSQEIQTDPKLLEWLNRLKEIMESIASSIDFSKLASSFGNLKDSLGFLTSGFLEICKGFVNEFLLPLAKWSIEDLLPRFFNATAEAFERIDFEKINSAFSELWESLLPFAQNVGDGLFWLYQNVLLPLGEWVANEALPAFLHAVSGGLNAINAVWETAQPILQWLWDNFLSKIAEFVGDAIVTCLNGIGDALQWISENEVATTILTALAIAIGLVTGAVVAWNIAGAIATGVTTALGVAISILTSPITLVVVAITALIAIIILLVKHWDEVKAGAKACWDKVVEIFTGVANWFNEKVVEPVKNFFGGMWENLKKGASNAWEGVKKVFGKVAEFFGSIFGNAWEGVKKIFSTGGKIFMGIVDGIANAFKTIVNAIIGGINKVVAVPFNAINGLLNGIRNIDILGFKPFTWIGTISVPQIPKLATGTVAYAPMLAQIGEYAGAKQNPEIVAPSDMIRQIVREEAGGKEVVIEHLEIVSKIGEDVLRRQVMKNIRLEEQAIGKPLLLN